MRLLCLFVAALVFTGGCAKMRSKTSARTTPGLSVVTPAAPTEAAAAPAPATAGQVWTVSGYGGTIADARDDAMRRAVNEVRDFLKENHPDLDRPLTPAYLTRSGIVHVVTEKTVTRENNQQAWQVDLQLEVKPEQFAELSDAARKDRMGPRQHVALLVLFGLCSMLGVAVLYLRLETATRGYSTGLLRFAAVTVLALALAIMIRLW